MKHNVFGILTSIVLLTTITGCGASYPNLTQEQYDQTVDYAAGLLMKYSYNNIDRLTNAAASASANASDSDSAFPGVENSVSDAGIDSSLEATAQESSMQSVSSNAATEASMQNSLNDSQDEIAKKLDGLFLKYNGYSVMSAYPADDAQGAISVDKGMKLLILNFTVSNHTTKEIKMNMAKKQASFLIYVNGKKQGYTMVTMFDNDLSTYQGSVPAGKSTDLVLILDLPENTAKSANTLGMTMKVDNQTSTYTLE